jgi:type I restriction enzyme M protein
VLFINASSEGNFEKGKRQNRLLPEHIEKIVSTYQYRNEEARYSRRVSMEEIEKNDFNLNISRYVSTATEEEKIELQAVNAELKEIEKRATKAAEVHNTFLRELGLSPI